MAEAGRKQGRTNFAVTCTLLSQYIKEKGSIADLGLGIAQDAAKGKSESVRPPTTMSVIPGADLCWGEDGAMELFSRSDDLGPAVLEDAREAARGQLTIFYGGKVLVFDSFPAEKAKDLMQLATKGNSTSQNSVHMSRSAQPNLPDLPIARKASLQRFLEKRKDRSNARSPYQVSSASPETGIDREDSKSWLGLAPQFSIPSLSPSAGYNG
ncbi:hypothetical protein OPV22_000525 [Ensete ventricosum]|uniref:Protein TIFY n=1 Tax=Ensete ventricosum TaxID=4639 RepID=A0AAV8QGE9_ENSVE|nr:hypothetical protein OPV22_000525 [Ensete ventricosum]